MTKLDLRTLRLAPGDYRRERVTASIAPFTAGAQSYHAEPPEVQARLGLTRLPGGLLFDLAFDVAIVGPCQRCLEPARADLSVTAREYQADVPRSSTRRRRPISRASCSTSIAGPRMRRSSRSRS